LEVVGWFIEALARSDGFAGLRDGFRLARELVESNWDHLYPMPDEDGVETRVAPLAGLNGSGGDGTLIAAIARIPITEGASTGPLATWSCIQAQELDRLDADKRQERITAGATGPDDVQTAVRETPVTFFVNLLEDIEGAVEEWAKLGRALDERCGADSPPSSAVKESLQNALDTVRHIARDVLPVEPEVGEPEEGSAPGGVPGAQASGPIGDREAAFRSLLQVADFFRKTEPHSPLPFLIERTVRWGRMPLPDLLQELIPDQNARDTFHQLTGVLGQGDSQD
ncbi:MAG: type VI secretion system protein TssA, partial [Planctomycetota bacterium]